jgi:two-component system, OmpR family, KDP operon response regulator KdpE
MTSVVVIEDEASLARALLINLRARGLEVHTSRTGTEGIEVVRRVQPDVVVLDLGLPDMDGADVVAGLRRWNNLPIVILSARATGAEKVKLLGLGADDYITKPFSVDELAARIAAAARRGALSATPRNAPVLECPDFTIDLSKGTVLRGGEQVRVTPTEWHLLELLAGNVGELVTQHEMLHQVWGEGYEKETQYLRVYIAQLRRKLEPDPAHPRYIITEPGLGYRLEVGT